MRNFDAWRSAAAVQARAVLHSNPRVHLPPFQPRRVHRIRKRDFGYLISFRLGRRNCRCRPKTAKARDPAHSAAFVNLRVALSHKSIRRLMSSPPPAADFPAATTTRGRTSAVERQRGALERPPWALPGRWLIRPEGPESTPTRRSVERARVARVDPSRTFSTQSDGDCPLRPRVPAPGSAPVCHGVPPLCYRPGRELDRYRS